MLTRKNRLHAHTSIQNRVNCLLTPSVRLLLQGQNADTLGLTGKERFTIDISNATPGGNVTVRVEGGAISEFTTKLRINTETELNYYRVRACMRGRRRGLVVSFWSCLYSFVFLRLFLWDFSRCFAKCVSSLLLIFAR